ncbi:MAG: LemA family protein [Gemmatimonadetes bacterium]|nr:LemA family protein [Gemmatimonadota bacterium]
MTEVLLLVAVVVVATFTWRTYNGLVSLRNDVRESLGGVYVQLQRRADLIPLLVETVKAHMEHERETLERVVALRAEFREIAADDAGRLSSNADSIERHLGGVVARSEAYPELRSSETFADLQEQLAETEDQIAAARRIYNANVADFNTEVESFPARLVASGLGFSPLPFFASETRA